MGIARRHRFGGHRWRIATTVLLVLSGAASAMAPPAAPAPGVEPDPAAGERMREHAAAFVDSLSPWLAASAVAGPTAELRWRARHATLATAARSPGAVAHWERVVATARASRAHRIRRQALSALSNIGYRGGDLALTRRVEEESLADARRIGDRREEADSLQDLGLVFTVTGEPDRAEEHLRAAIAIWKTLDVPMGLARGMRGLARVQEMKGRYPQALEQHVGALELMLRHGTPIEQSESYYSLSRLFLNLEDAEAGLRAVDEAIRLMGATPPDFPLGLNLATRSQLLRMAGRVDEAVADGLGAVAAFERTGSGTGVAIGQLALGQARVLDGAAEEGLALLAAGEAGARAGGEATLLGDLLLARGAMLAHVGRPADAIVPLEAAMAIGDELGLDHLRQNVALQLEAAHAALGRPEQALQWSRRAFEYRGRLTSLGDLAELGQETLDSPAVAARSRFMALEAAPASRATATDPATSVVPAAFDGVEPLSRWWLLALPSLVLLWGLVRVLRSARRLHAEKESIARRQHELETVNHDLRTQSARLQRQVAVDALTGAMTRAAFAAELDATLKFAAAQDRPLALLVFDLDRFKAINDQHGHLAGDAALRLVAGVVREKLRSQDLFGRFGGDEFLVAVPGMDGAAAEGLGEAIRFEIVWRAPDQQPPMPDLSISVGLAIADPGRGYDAESLFRRADGALYRAKRGGRNRVVADDPQAAGTAVPDDRAPRQWTIALPD